MNIENNPTSLNNTQAQASLNNIQESVRKRHNKLSTTLMHEYVPCFHVFSFQFDSIYLLAHITSGSSSLLSSSWIIY
jgi:hypothetical protein